MTRVDATAMDRMLLHREIEDFLHLEADLLDERRFDEWLALCAEDIRYWMPLVWNVPFSRGEEEHSREKVDSAWIDEGKVTLGQRVKQLSTGLHWAEEPRSRVSHLVTNVRVGAPEDTADGPEVPVRANFMVWRARNGKDVTFVGSYEYRLVERDGQLLIRSKRVVLDMTSLRPANDVAIIL